MEIRSGRPGSDNQANIASGTKVGRGDYKCLFTGTPIDAEYIRSAGRAGKIGYRLLAIAAQGPRGRGRSYHPASEEQLAASEVPAAAAWLQTELPEQALGFRIQKYGILARILHEPAIPKAAERPA